MQRTTSANVTADGEKTGTIGKGLVVLLAAEKEDSKAQAELLASKIAVLRIFEDASGRLSRLITDIEGAVLLISNFTLMLTAAGEEDRNLSKAASYSQAEDLYNVFILALKSEGIKNVQTGVFGADMKVELINDGPVTLILDSNEMR